MGLHKLTRETKFNREILLASFVSLYYVFIKKKIWLLMKIFSFFLSINDKKNPTIHYTHTWASIVLSCGCESITAWSISSSETLLMRHHIKFIDLLVGADQFIVYMLQKHTRNTDTINYILHQITGAAICTRTRTRPACLVHPCLIQLLFVIFIMELVRYQGWSTNKHPDWPSLYTHHRTHPVYLSSYMTNQLCPFFLADAELWLDVWKWF